MLALALFVAVLVYIVVIASRASARRRAVRERMAYLQGLVDERDDTRAIETAWRQRRPRMPYPDLTKREGYWRVPPCAIASDELAQAKIAELGPDQIEVCFTGWTYEEEKALTALAEHAGWRVRTGVAKHLVFLCAGQRPGPVKLAMAVDHDVAVISGAQFESLSSRGAD